MTDQQPPERGARSAAGRLISEVGKKRDTKSLLMKEGASYEANKKTNVRQL